MAVTLMTHGRRQSTTRHASVRVRTEVAAVAKTFDYAVPAGWERRRARRHAGAGAASTGARCGAGWSTTDVGTPAGVDVLPAQVVAGLGPAARPWWSWRSGRPGAGPGRPRSSSRIGVAGDHRARAAPTPPLLARHRRRRRRPATDARRDGRRPGAAGAHRGAPAPGDRSDRPRAVRRRRTRRARPRRGSVLVLVPSVGLGRAAGGAAGAPGVPGHGQPGSEARAGWPVVVGSRAGAWAPVPRLAAAVVLDAHDAAYREESAPDLQRGRRRARAGPARGRALRPGLAGPAGGAGRRGRAADGGAVTRPRSGRAGPSLERVDRRGADPRTRLFSEEFVRLARSVLDDAGGAGARARSSASTTGRAAPACWPAGTAASWPAAPAAARPRRSRAARRCCAARAAARPGRSCAPPAAGCG